MNGKNENERNRNRERKREIERERELAQKYSRVKDDVGMVLLSMDNQLCGEGE